ncbi:MAG: LamG domain-containing protein [Thaumarchaeota archaeon]|nr:MAG: LamG domain-containing protein [Nitrososphaerota archaeon]
MGVSEWMWGGTLLTCKNPLPSQGKWYYAVFTWNGTTNILYINGTRVGSSTTAHQSGTPSSFYVGTYSSLSELFNGNLDEIRISNIARSANWIATEYNNQASPSTFFTVQNPEMYAQAHTSK